MPAYARPIRLDDALQVIARSGATVLARFVSLALFGIALSIPLIAVVLFASAQRGLDWVAGLSRRLPFWTGLLFIVLGMWSIVFGLFARVSHR